jgi:hypothetical protein
MHPALRGLAVNGNRQQARCAGILGHGWERNKLPGFRRRS